MLAIGSEVTLGDGIDAPTPTAAPVMAVFITTKSDLFAFQLDGNGELEMTTTHPVWCETRNEWVLAGALKVGDRIRPAGGAGQACITNIRLAQAGATVYNLTVAGGATFFVGDDKAWVHNCNFAALIKSYMQNAAEWIAVASQRQPSSNIRNKGGWSVTELIEDAAGNKLERHTLYKANGSVFEPAHVRPPKLDWDGR